MKSRILRALAVLVAFVIVGSIYLAAATAADLLAARRALQGSVEDLDSNEIEEARDSVASAADRLDGVIASTIGVVPVIGQNLHALESVADGAYPVLDSALQLRRIADEIQDLDLVEEGRVRLDLIDRIGTPLAAEADALGKMTEDLEEARSGWLLPPVYDEMTDLMRRTEQLHETAAKASSATQLARDMLGGDGPRTYLVVLLNNVELRGAGGIVSGVGTVTTTDGGIRLGEFSPYADLGSSPHESVAAPPDFVRRFGFAKAHTTLWINTSYSPEVPDVALVASRLYEKVRNVATDGAIVVDPRGVAALMPPGATVGSPRQGQLNADSLPEYVYSTAYEELGGPERARREALLNVGRAVFKRLAREGPGGVRELDDLAGAVSSAHLRFISFDPEEDRLLRSVAASGSLPEAQDSVFVSVQNQGADKLDFWIRRSVGHRCSIEESVALCETTATLRNQAPEGLTSYVSPRPQNESNEFLEIYVPDDADVTAVERDGEPSEFIRETQGDRVALGTQVRLVSGEKTTLRVTYTLPLEGSYQLTVTPQPLAHDAQVRVELATPDAWTVHGPDDSEEGALVYEGALEGTLEFSAGPIDKSGLSGFWESFSDFWSDDLF